MCGDGSVFVVWVSAVIVWRLNAENYTLATILCPPRHAAWDVTAWFRGQNVEVLPWSVHSTDLSSSENIWRCMIKKLQERNCQSEAAEQLSQQIEAHGIQKNKIKIS
ncbi:hypothetical protein Trydic_g1340 [Trypoxylus dichotomus]